MPKPRKGESQTAYLARAIPVLLDEGRPKKQAVAIAYSMFREGRKRKKTKKRGK